MLVESYPDIEPGNFLTEAHARELRTRGIRTTWVDEVDSRLPRVLASLDRDDRVVIAETRPAAVEMLGETVRKFDAGLLWWDGWWMRDVPPDPVDALRANVAQSRIAGAGIDMSGLTLAAASEVHVSPLELLHIGWRADAATLTVILRALAIAHARGANARLTVCADELDDAVDPMRLAFLAQDFAVGRSVTCRDTRPRGEGLSRYHGLLDLSNDEPVNPRFLEAMACGVPVLSSNPKLAALVDGGPVPLGFRPGDARQLAARIVDLSHVGYENFQGLRARVRDDVVAGHSLEVWADTVVAAMTNEVSPEVPVVALPVPARVPSPAALAVVESAAWPAAVAATRAKSRRVRWSPPAHLGKVAVVAGLAVGTAVGTYALAGGTNRDTVFEPGLHARTTTSTVAPTTASTPPTTGLGVAPVVPAPPPIPPPTAPPAPVATAPSATTPAASGPSAEESPSEPAAATPAPEPAPETTPSPPATVAPDPTETAPPDTTADPTSGTGRGRGRGRDQG